jgi:hypothetical protein
MAHRLPPDVPFALGALAAFAFLSVSAAPAAAAEEAVDLELVLASDASRSIDPVEAKLQRTGTADAFRSREIIKAITSGSHGKIAVAYVDYSSRDFNTLVVNWRVISDEKSALAFAGALLKAPLSYGQRTSISDALEYAAALIGTNNYNGMRKVIDISGDGPNNYGRRVDVVRDEVVAKGIVVNGLAIVNAEDSFTYQYMPDLDRYFSACVTGGPGAFVMKATSFADYARAIRGKLFREIANLDAHDAEKMQRAAAEPDNDAPILIRTSSPPLMLAQAQRVVPKRAPPKRPAYEQGCDIGERMRRGWGYDGLGGGTRNGNVFEFPLPPLAPLRDN